MFSLVFGLMFSNNSFAQKNKVDTKTDSLDNYLKYFKPGFSLREGHQNLTIENAPSNLDYSYNYVAENPYEPDEYDSLFNLGYKFPENFFNPRYYSYSNRIYIIGYNQNESLMYLEIREDELDYFRITATLFIQNLTNNKIQSILHLTDDGYEGVEDWIIVKQEEDLYSDDSEKIKVDTNDFNYFLPKIFIQKMNEHILSNNIIPFGAGKFINSNEVYYNDNGKNLKINFVESQIGDNYKLTAINGSYNKIIFSDDLNKFEDEYYGDTESYKFLGCFELPGTDYLAILLMHRDFFYGNVDGILEYLEIISYKYK